MPSKPTKKQAIAAPEAAKPPDWLDKPPLTPDALHEWLINVLDVRIARTPIIPGHAAPFDYLCHTFFEGAFPRPSAPTAPYSSSPDCIVWANRGGGKTYLGALATLLDLLFKPGIQVRILGGSLDQSLRMRAHLAAFLLNPNLDGIPKRIAAKRITVVHEQEGKTSVAEVLAASQTSVRGTRVQKLRCDEVDLFDPEVWEAAQLVTRSIPGPGPWCPTIRGSVEALSTMHRPFGLMWNLVGPPASKARRDGADTTEMRSGGAEEMTSEKAGDLPSLSSTPHPLHPSSLSHHLPAPRPMRPTFRWGVLDVLEHCTDEHTCATCILHPQCEGRAKTLIAPGKGGHFAVPDAVGMKARVSSDTWQSEMLCLRPSRSDTVYPKFDAATHVVGDEAASPFPRYIGGMDFGFRSESVLLLAGVDDDGAITVLREHARTGAVVDEFADALDRWVAQGLCAKSDIEFIGVDPAGAAVSQVTKTSCVDVLRARGLRIRSRASSIDEGIQLVRNRIDPAAGTPRLRIHHSCVRLIECLTRYRYDPDRPESPNPLKELELDHAPDALRYMVLNLDAASKTECVSYA